MTLVASGVSNDMTRAVIHNKSLDKTLKSLAMHRNILAFILQQTVREFALCSIDEILASLSAEDARYVPSDISPEISARDADSTLKGIDTADKVPGLRDNYYDLCYDLKVPGTERKVMVNLEIQAITSLKYSLAMRAGYYASRLVAFQGDGRVLVDSEFDNIKKVYDIWICPRPPEKHANLFFAYSLAYSNQALNKYTNLRVPEYVRTIQRVKDEAQAKGLSGRYDIMEVDFISLSKTDLNSEVPIVRFLSNLFSSDASTLEERKRVLEEEFNISMTLEICEEMESVCTLTESVLQEGVEIGREQGLEEGREQGLEEGIEIGTVTTLANNVISLMRNLGCDADTAMDYLAVEGPIREVVAEKVMSAMVAY